MSFHPFTIECPTCASRLNVVESSIVGTITACPKCGSMVKIDRPSPQVSLGTADVDSQAITQDAIQPPDVSTDRLHPGDNRRFQEADFVEETSSENVEAPAEQPWQR